MMLRYLMLLAAAALLAAQPREALVIGNDAYANVPKLTRAVIDARSVAAALPSAGFRVTTLENTSREALERGVDSWLGRLPAGAAAFVYYAGHAVEINGTNYLLAVDIFANDAVQARTRSMSAQELMERIAARGASVQILVLDACRNNPFPADRSIGGRGLAAMNAVSGSFIAFSTSPREIAADNGVYAGELTRALRVSGLSLSQMFGRVGAGVQDATSRRQVPWFTSSVAGEFYLSGAPAAAVVTNSLDADVTFWNSIKDSTDAADYQAYKRQFPRGQFTELADLRISRYTAAAAPPAVATPNSADARRLYDQAKAVYDAKDYARALPLLKQAADAGSTNALYWIGNIYDFGLGVAEDQQEALRWFRRGADRGEIGPLVRIGLIYQYDLSNREEAIRWFRQAADKGDESGRRYLEELLNSK